MGGHGDVLRLSPAGHRGAPRTSPRGGLCRHSPSALSACSNSGRSLTWRSFSMSGAPRWVLPQPGAIAASPRAGHGSPRTCPCLPGCPGGCSARSPLPSCSLRCCPSPLGSTPRWAQDRGRARHQQPPGLGCPVLGSSLLVPCASRRGRAGVCAPAPEGGGGSLCPAPARGGSCPSVCGCLCCIFPAFCAPLPDSSPSSRAMPGPQPGPPGAAGTWPGRSVSAQRQPHLLCQLS